MSIVVEGKCDEKFSKVRDAFIENFENRGDVGAALCIYHEGNIVVDLWGGYRNAERTIPWTPDTLVQTYSNGKGWLATCMHILLDRKLIELDTPVAHYWPEFAKHNKQNVLIRHILSHTAGVPAPTMRVPDEAIYDWQRMLDYVADSELYWKPGTQLGYHAATFGWLNGGVLDRVTGMTPGDFLKKEIAEPLDADLYWGLSSEYDDRIADFLAPAPTEQLSKNQMAGNASMMAKKAFNNPPRRFRAANTREWRAAVIPASNGHASARGLSRMYAAMSLGGTIEGITLMSAETVDIARSEQIQGPDVISGGEARRALGYALSMPGPDDPRANGAFGHGGLGGSLGYADVDNKISFGYVMNQAGQNIDHRNRELSRALYNSLAS
tara:strand:- start:4294 stop:5439 length:1146 start_codon:yes stop_codon:yes gene_type:complete